MLGLALTFLDQRFGFRNKTLAKTLIRPLGIWKYKRYHIVEDLFTRSALQHFQYLSRLDHVFQLATLYLPFHRGKRSSVLDSKHAAGSQGVPHAATRAISPRTSPESQFQVWHREEELEAPEEAERCQAFPDYS